MITSVESNKSNTQQAIWVGIGSMSSFMLALLSAAILSRYFSKTDYGTYKQVIYIYNTLLVLFSAGLNGAYSYFLPKQSNEQGKDFIFKLLKIFVILGFCFSGSLFLLASFISGLFNNPDLTKALKLFSVVPVLMLPTNGLDGVYASIRKTHVIAIYTTVTRFLALAFITLPVILLKGTYLTAIFGWIISSFMTFLLAVYLILRPYSNVIRSQSVFSVREIFKYSLPLMLATIYGILIRFADQFFISRYYGTEVFAEFSNGFMDLPFVGIMAGATITVLFPLFSKFSKSSDGIEEICQTWKSATEKSVIIIYPVLVFFIFNAKSSVIALYGEQYSASANYFIIGMLVGFFNIIVFQTVLFALGKTRIYSRIHMVQAILIWVAGYAVIYFAATPLTFALLSRVFYIFQVCAGILYATRILDVSLKDVIPFKIILKALLQSSLICGIISWILGLLTINVFLRLGLAGLISGTLVIVTGDLFGINYWSTLKGMVVNTPGYYFAKNKKDKILSLITLK